LLSFVSKADSARFEPLCVCLGPGKPPKMVNAALLAFHDVPVIHIIGILLKACSISLAGVRQK
jgi:hypothetical protein